MKVGYLTADWGSGIDPDGNKILHPGGSCWYRVHLPAMEMTRNGHEVVIAEQVAVGENGGLTLKDWRTEEDHDDCEVIVMQRIMNDFGPELIEAAHEVGQYIVNDVDDWYWGLHPSNNAYKITDPKVNPLCNRDIYKQTLEMSDMVIASTAFLRDKISEWNPNTHLVRNALDVARWEMYTFNEPAVVGWVGATSHRSGDLETLKGVVGPFVEKNDLGFHHSGWQEQYPHACELFDVDVKRSTSSKLCPLDAYPQQFKFFDISLVPLNMIDFNFAKSALKGIESAAAGRPFIAQAAPEYRWAHEEFGLGRIARKPYQWRRHLEELLSPDVRLEEARRNREIVEKHFDIATNYVQWEELLSSFL